MLGFSPEKRPLLGPLSTVSPPQSREKALSQQCSSEGEEPPTGGPLPAIDPELAAMVVREYLLPMFEGRKKKSGMPAVMIDGRPRSGLESRPEPRCPSGLSNPEADAIGPDLVDTLVHLGAPKSGVYGENAPKAGVYGEMKLSDELLDEVQEMKSQCAFLRHKLQISEGKRAALDQELAEMSSQNGDILVELKMVRFQDDNLQARIAELEQQRSVLHEQQLELDTKLRQQQVDNTLFSRRLFEEEAKYQQLSRTVAQNQSNASLSKLENDVLAEQVKNLHSAVHTLADATTLGARLERVCQQHTDDIKDVYTQKDRIEMELATVHEERKSLHNAERELSTANDELKTHRQQLQQGLDEEKSRGRQDFLSLFDEKETVRKDLVKVEKKYKELNEERDSARQRLKKYRARRKMFEQEQKTCKHCGKEYLESENFNWSCRTHISDFGGEMWWCCGKLGKDAIGCKFSKHESKDDDDDMDEQEKKEKEENEKKLKNLNIRCYSCKDIGHKAKDCPRDPNPRTKYQSIKENRRIEHLQYSSRKTGHVVNGGSITKLINTKVGFDTDSPGYIPAAQKLAGGGEEESPFADVMKLCLDTVRTRKREMQQDIFEGRLADQAISDRAPLTESRRPKGAPNPILSCDSDGEPEADKEESDCDSDAGAKAKDAAFKELESKEWVRQRSPKGDAVARDPATAAPPSQQAE